jgi:hypothetical protein
MTIRPRQSVETILSSSPSTLVAYPIHGYAFVGQCADMLWSRPRNNKGESG